MNIYVYILYSESKDRYYVGYSSNVKDRLARHNSGRSKSTRSGRPWLLVYLEACADRSEAYKREQVIKGRKSRHYIEQLVATYESNPYPLS